jgi:hypothetical protein
MSGAIALSNITRDMGALSVLNSASNNLRAVVGWTRHPEHISSYRYKHAAGRHQEQLPEGEEMGKSCIFAIANAIPDMRALLVLSLKDNGLGTEEGGKVVVGILKGNSVLQELDLSGNSVYPASDNSPKFVVALSPGLADNGAISSVNVLGNSIGVEQAQELIQILQAKDKLTTLCGFSGDETELDLSNKNLSAGCAVLVANEISDMRALSALFLSKNGIIKREVGTVLADMLKANTVLTTLDGAWSRRHRICPHCS